MIRCVNATLFSNIKIADFLSPEPGCEDHHVNFPQQICQSGRAVNDNITDISCALLSLERQTFGFCGLRLKGEA
jgi:hypothetical protein